MTATAGPLLTTSSILDGARGGEHIDKLLQVRAITELPGHRDILERHHKQVAEIDEQPFIEAEKTGARRTVHDSTREAR
jgi:hypothetical protein